MKHVGIVGGGASGVLTAIALLRSAREGDVITLFEPNPDLGRGVAYRSHDAAHVLNARAAQMSAHEHLPADFGQWLADHHAIPVDEALNSFASRAEYGTYLASRLSEARARSLAKFLHVLEPVTDIEAGEALHIRAGRGSVRPDAVVLATGNLPAQLPVPLIPWAGHPNVVEDVYRPGALASVPIFDDVLVLGSGLTAFDAVLTLVRQGHRVGVAMRSRSGLIPQAHALGRPTPPPEEVLRAKPLWKSLLRYLRSQGDEWRSAMDGLRPLIPQLWASMPLDDRRRFLRRLRPFWDSHRHRMPEWIASIVASLRTIGYLDVSAGIPKCVSRRDDAFQVEFEDGELVRAHWILNCTGPSIDLKSARIPVVDSLVQSGAACYDELGLGLDADTSGRVDPVLPIWAVGALCRGARWESTAIPEIRAQAATVARAIFAGHD